MTNTFDLSGMTLAELLELEKGIKAVKATKRDEAKAANAEAKEARIAEFKGNLNEGDIVSFLYGRTNDLHTGSVVRASEKSVTVRADVFAENSKNSKDTNYVRYDRIVEVLEAAPVAETDEVEAAAM